MDNAPITIQQQQSLQAASPTTQPSQLLRFRHSCENCRRRKIKCSGTRPICEHCLRRGIECIYKPLARSTRRSTSVASSPAMSASSATGSYGFPRQPQARARPGQPQPISIPMSGGGSMQYPYAMPLHLLHQQGASARYSSAPTNAESPYLQAAYQQQAQFKQPRPATAIPPHLCNVSSIGGSSLSPLGSPQLAYMYGSLPTDMGASLGSFNSMQSDATDLASPGSAGDRMNLVTMPNSLYDVQIPGSPAAQQQAAMSFAGSRSGGSGGKNSGNGISPAPSPLTSATAGFGLPTQFPVPGKQSGIGEGMAESILEAGRARTFVAANHKRTMTDESSDSISNVPLIERSTFSSSYEADSGYPSNAMSVDYNTQQQQQYQQYQQYQQQQEHYYSLPSDFGTLIPSAENSDGSVLACNSQAYIDLISSYGLGQDPTTVAAASAANYSMLLDSKLGGWESQHQLQQPQQQQQQQQQSSGLISGIAPELTVYPPSQSQHQEPP
ncbi:hypothetical protein GGI08_003387 [Coemansia sp. S2]|nr:hypothetical protein GGI08_003387 [Coemansia sp. S2]